MFFRINGYLAFRINGYLAFRINGYRYLAFRINGYLGLAGVCVASLIFAIRYTLTIPVLRPPVGWSDFFKLTTLFYVALPQKMLTVS